MILADKAGTLVSDSSLIELHAFAARLDLGGEDFRGGPQPFYDLKAAKAVERAVRSGARLVSSEELRRRSIEGGTWLPTGRLPESC